jgi:hypothetical protein
MTSQLFYRDQTLPQTLISTVLTVPEIPGRFRLLRDIPGVTGFISGSSQSRTHNVHIDPTLVDDVDETIRRVIDTFSAEQKGFSCTVGPSDQPANQHLIARLKAAGLEKSRDLVGLVLNDVAGPIYYEPTVEIQEIGGAELAEQVDLLAEAYGTTREAAELFVLKFSPDRRDVHFRAYLAYFDNRPVGFGCMLYVPDRPIANLRMAGTLKPYRELGVYHSLVARRLANARADGKQKAIVSSIKGTSTSSLADFGFEQFCELSVYVWEVA